MRNNIDDISFYFKKSDGYQITNRSNNFAIVINVNTFQIAEIVKTSANHYEVITASCVYCQRICEKNFYSALKRVQHFFADTKLHNRL